MSKQKPMFDPDMLPPTHPAKAVPVPAPQSTPQPTLPPGHVPLVLVCGAGGRVEHSGQAPRIQTGSGAPLSRGVAEVQEAARIANRSVQRQPLGLEVARVLCPAGLGMRQTSVIGGVSIVVENMSGRDLVMSLYETAPRAETSPESFLRELDEASDAFGPDLGSDDDYDWENYDDEREDG